MYCNAPSAILEVANLQSDNSPVCQTQDKYTFDGLAYNTYGYFASLRCIFASPAGARKTTSNEQNVIPLQKKLSGNWVLFFGKSIQRHPYSVCENDVNNQQNVRTCYMPNH